MGCYFIELFLALFVGQVQFSKQSGRESRRKAFIDEAYGASRRADKPFGKIPDLARFGTIASVAVQRQTDDPAGDLVFPGELLEVLDFDGWGFALEGLQGACPGPARIA